MSSDVSNNTSPVKGPKPTILFDNNEEEDERSDEVTGADKIEETACEEVFDNDQDTSLKLDERYFHPRVTPSACSDLINFDSPYRP